MTAAGMKPFEEAYVELFVRAERVATRILGNRGEAEDVAAETMVKAMGSWRQVHTYSIPWVTRVATNMALDVVRRRRAVPPPRTVVSDPEDTEGRIVLVAALERLSGRQRQAVVLRYVVGLSSDETASTMGLSVTTVKTHVQRGLRVLREQFGDEIEEMNDVAV